MSGTFSAQQAMPAAGLHGTASTQQLADAAACSVVLLHDPPHPAHHPLQLPAAEFAYSMGLPTAPKLRFLKKAGGAGIKSLPCAGQVAAKRACRSQPAVHMHGCSCSPNPALSNPTS